MPCGINISYQYLAQSTPQFPFDCKIENTAMAAKTAIKVAEATKTFVEDKKEYVDVYLEKVRDHEWSERLGKGCKTTGQIVTALGNFVPGLGIVGGALSLGGTLLDPTATKKDLARGQVIIAFGGEEMN